MRRPWLALLLPLVRAQELAVVRSLVAAEDTDESLRSWSIYRPCRWSPATPVDLILVSGQQVQSEWRPSEPTHVNDTTWRHCFREILVMPMEAAMQRYEGAHDMESAASLRRNMVFLHVLSRLYEGFAADYDSFFYMEADATAVRTGWLERFITEAVHLKNSAIRGSSYRGDGWNHAATDLLHHINGNAIYNLRHPWLRSLHEQLAREAFTEELAQIPFDLRMANLTLEAQRGSQEFLGTASAVPVSEEVYQDDSKLIGSFGSTLLNHSFEPGVFIRQGSSRNMFFNLEAEISLGVAAFEADLYQKFNETLTSRHPFRKVLVLSYDPRALQLSEFMATPRGPTEVRFKHAKTSRHLALCEIASQVTTKFFIFSDIYHLISGPASVLVDGEGRPVLPYLDANSLDCASTFGCGPALQQARQLFGIQLQRHFDTFDVVLRTAEIQRFCKDWQLAVPQGSFETCAVEFGPTADDFFAWEISRGQSPFESYVPKDKAKVRWIPVMRRHAPAPMDLARPCSAYRQSDYERMKANISMCSTIIENATRCEETITSHGPCVFNVFGHCTENKKMLYWSDLASEDSDSYLSRRLDMKQQNFSNLTTTEHTETTVMTTTYHVNRSNGSTTTETSHMTMMTTTTEALEISTNETDESDESDESTTSHTTGMTATTNLYKIMMNDSNGSTTTETSHMTMMTTTDMYMPGMNGSNGSTTTETSHMTMMTTTDMYMPGMNGSNGSTTTETSHMTMMTTTDKYMPGMNGSNGSTTTETSHMTMITSTDMYMPGMNGSNGSTTTETTSSTATMLVVPVARLEGCMGLSVSDVATFFASADAITVLKRVLAEAAGGVAVDYVEVSMVVGSSCAGRRLVSGVLSERRLQESVMVNYVIVFPASMGEDEALEAAQNSTASLSQLSLSEISAMMAREMSLMPSLSGMTVVVTTTPTVVMIVLVGETNTTTSTTQTTTTSMTTTSTNTTSTSLTWTSATNTTTITSVTGTTSMTTTATNTSTTLTLTSTLSLTTATNTTTTTSETGTTSMTTTSKTTSTTASDTATSTSISVTNTTTMTSVTGTTSLTTTFSSTTTFTGSSASMTNTTTQTSVTTTTSMTTTSTATSVTSSTSRTMSSTLTSTSATSSTSVTGTSTSMTNTTTFTMTTTTSFTTSVSTATITTSTSVTMSTSLTSSSTYTMSTTSSLTSFTITSTSLTNTSTSTSLTRTTSYTDTSTSETSTSTSVSTSITSLTTTSTSSFTGTSTSVSTSITSTTSQTTTQTTTNTTTTSSTSFTTSATSTTSTSETMTSTTSLSTTTESTTTQSTTTVTTITQTTTSVSSTVTSTSTTSITFTSTSRTISSTISSTTSGTLTSTTSGTETSTTTHTESTTSQTTSSTSETSTTTSFTMTSSITTSSTSTTSTSTTSSSTSATLTSTTRTYSSTVSSTFTTSTVTTGTSTSTTQSISSTTWTNTTTSSMTTTSSTATTETSTSTTNTLSMTSTVSSSTSTSSSTSSSSSSESSTSSSTSSITSSSNSETSTSSSSSSSTSTSSSSATSTSSSGTSTSSTTMTTTSSTATASVTSSTTSISGTSTTTATLKPGTCPPPVLVGIYDASECIYQLPGDSCLVYCANKNGWYGPPSQFNCTTDEVYVGTPPECFTTTSTSTKTMTKTELVVCNAGLPLGVGIDLSGCSGQVMSGEICTVTCAQGFEGTPQDYICNPFTARFEGTAITCQRQRCDVQTLPARTDLDLTGCQETVVGDFCLVSCGEGYVPTDASFQCMSDLSFQGTAPTCDRLPCDASTLPTTEGLDTSNCLGLLVGDSCSVTCLSGYAAVVSSSDPATMQCHLNTSFTGNAPECKAKDCLVPSIWVTDPSFNTTCDGTKHGDTCVGQCSAGYTGQSTQFQCNNGQLWGAPPTCTGLVCAFQGFQLSVGLLASDCYGKTTGETCQMQCIRGYDLVGDPSSTCQADGSFTVPTSVCQPKTCGSLSSVTPFSTVDVADTCGNSSSFGEICMSYCDMGFDLTGNTTVLVCDEAGTASAGYVEYIPETGQTLAAAQSSGPSCVAKNCTVGIPNDVLGATTDCNGKVTYETCTVEPMLGYTLQAGDSNTLQCLPDGSFNQTAPTILPGTCPDPSFGAGVGSSCQGKVIGSDCWAYCLSGWSGTPKKYLCAADVAANALLLQADSTEISCTYTGRRLNSGRRLQTGCTSTAVAAVGLSSPQYFSDCDGKADTEVCIAHCSFGWVMTETAPSIFTCSSGSLTGASLPTCTAVPCSFGFPSGLGIAHDCDGTRTSQTCSASCTGTGYTYASGASAEVWTCNAGGSVSGTLPQCERKSCTDLSLGSTYVHTCVNKLYQDACGVSCASGYRGTGAQFLCEADGSFSGTLPVCVGNPCQNDLPNSSSWSAGSCDSLTTGQSCDVTCKLGFSGSSTNLTCDASGQLLGNMPVCQPNLCPASTQLVSGEHTHTCQDIAFGSSCTVFCASGYELGAGSSIQDWSCGLVGTALQLQGTLPSCVPQPCSSGLPVNNSEVVSDCEGVRTGESCHQYCAMGYENTTEEANFVCQTSGQAGLASSQTTQCQPISCEGSSVNFSLVQHSCQGTVYSRSCYASCIQGYSATPAQWFCGDAAMGPELGFQVYKGITLRGVVPSCVASPCEFNLPVGVQYSHNCTGVTTGSSCLVQCADGWDGMMEVLTCGTDAALSGSFPSCNPVTSTRTATSSSTQTTTQTSTLTVDKTSITATRTSSSTTVFSYTCPEEVPAIPGAGAFNCTGRDGAGQECRADCDSPEQDTGNFTEAVILCRFDLVWEVRQSCPSSDGAAGNIPILVYVGITVGSCAACMLAIGVLTYFGRKGNTATVAPKQTKEPKKVKVKEQPEPMLAWATPKSTGQQDFNLGDLPSKADVEQPPRPEDMEPSTPVPATPLALVPAEDEDPSPLRQGFAKPSPKKVTKEFDIAMHAQGLGGTEEPESTSVLSPAGQQLDPHFWDWANQFWDWANDNDGAGQQALPPPPPPMIPNHGEMLRGIGAYSEGPPPLPPLPLKLHSRPYLGSPSMSAAHAPPPVTPLPATIRSQVSMPLEDPSPLHSLPLHPLPSAVEMGHHHSEPVHSESSVSRQRTLEDMLYNPEIDGASMPPQALAVRRRSSGRPRSRPGRRRSGRQPSVRDMSPTQERRNSRAAANLHDGASMSALEMFSLRSPGGPPELPAMRLSSPDTDARRSGSAASSATRSVASSTLRRAAARNEVIVNIKDPDQHR